MSNDRNIELDRLSELFKALANPHRLRIFLRLLSCCAPGSGCKDEGTMAACVGEIGRDLGIVPSTVSHHLRELRRAGLIRMERRGRSVECCADPAALDSLRRFFDAPPPAGGPPRTAGSSARRASSP